MTTKTVKTTNTHMCSTNAKLNRCSPRSRSQSTPSQSSSLRPPAQSERSCTWFHHHSLEQHTTSQCFQRRWWGWRGKSQRRPVMAPPRSAVGFEPHQLHWDSGGKRALWREGWVAQVKQSTGSITACRKLKSCKDCVTAQCTHKAGCIRVENISQLNAYTKHDASELTIINSWMHTQRMLHQSWNISQLNAYTKHNASEYKKVYNLKQVLHGEF